MDPEMKIAVKVDSSTSPLNANQLQGNNSSHFDYVSPLDIIKTAIEIGNKKASATTTALTWRTFLKAMNSGSYLGMSITLTLVALSIGWDKVAAALLFPFGFIMLILMGNDLATGNFALLPMAYLSGKTATLSKKIIAVNWAVVYMGNFLGALLYLFILWGGMTHFGQRDESQYQDFKDVLCIVARSKTLGYYDSGAAGWFAAMFNGILCNWLVTMGVFLSFTSRSTIGKVVAMYIPIAIFICIGFEHSIVNLFLLPAGLAYDCDTYNFGQWWWWNQIPVTIGNMFGGIVLTGITYMAIWSKTVYFCT